jgi:hypothetical protein
MRVWREWSVDVVCKHVAESAVNLSFLIARTKVGQIKVVHYNSSGQDELL